MIGYCAVFFCAATVTLREDLKKKLGTLRFHTQVHAGILSVDHVVGFHLAFECADGYFLDSGIADMTW